ncbi:MAG: alpha/beta hydrolase [Planctomycetota bacterium]
MIDNTSISQSANGGRSDAETQSGTPTPDAGADAEADGDDEAAGFENGFRTSTGDSERHRGERRRRVALSEAELALLSAPPDYRGSAEQTEQLDDGVLVHRNLRYAEGERRDAVRHRLDLYLPARATMWPQATDGAGDAASSLATKRSCPLVVWFHGGGWQLGTKDDMNGIYGRIGASLAARGIAFANANYRLTPRVRHPGHIEDAAAAVSYLQSRASEFDITPGGIFLAGHSAGAHLAALLATQPDWLEEYDMDPASNIAGVIPVSGVFDLKSFRDFVARRGGISLALTRFYERTSESAADAVSDASARTSSRTSAGATLTEDSPRANAIGARTIGRKRRSGKRGPTMDFTRGRWDNPFPPGTLTDASPMYNVHADTPPMLIIHESLGDLIPSQALAFERGLARHGVSHERIEIEGEDHFTILVDMLRPGNRSIEAMTRFIGVRSRERV